MGFQRVKKLLQENKLDAALDELQGLITDGELADELLILKANYYELESKIRKNVLEFEKATIEKNRLRDTMLEIINAAQSGTVMTSRRGANPVPPAQNHGLRNLLIGLGLLAGVAILFIFIQSSKTPDQLAKPSVSDTDTTARANVSNKTYDISDNENAVVGDNNVINIVKQQEKKEARLQFESMKREFGEHLKGDSTLVKAKLSLSFEDPIAYTGDAKILDTVKQQIYKKFFGESAVRADFAASAAQYSTAFFADFQERFKKFEPPMYYLTRTATALYNEKEVLTIKIGEDSFTGGAHGNFHSEYYTYDLRTGLPVTYYDVFRGKTDKAMIALLQKGLMDINGVSTLAELEALGYWEIKPTQNFYFTKKSMCFVYSPYEVASYVGGKNEVCLRYDDINLYFSESFPLHRLFD